MEISGKDIIDVICKRLDFENIRAYDSNIINKLRSLSTVEMNQLVNLGGICQWHNDEIGENNHE